MRIYKLQISTIKKNKKQKYKILFLLEELKNQ